MGLKFLSNAMKAFKNWKNFKLTTFAMFWQLLDSSKLDACSAKKKSETNITILNLAVLHILVLYQHPICKIIGLLMIY